VWFPQLHWLEAKWVGKNLDNVFDNSNDNLWDAVWGSYMSWSRAYKNTFEFLAEHGKYAIAIDRIGKSRKFEYSKDPDEGLTEHLMIGFFNGWIEFGDELLKRLLEKAPPGLRGKAARFLTTGFKAVKEEEKDHKEVSDRMRGYWRKRLAAIRDNAEGNVEEAIELTGWVGDSLLEPKETLELLEQTLELSGGRIGNMRDARDFVEGVCELGEGNELLALRCLKKASADENMRVPWAALEEELVGFLERICGLPDEHEGLDVIREEAIEVADSYGRFQPDKFRGVWERLRRRR
jgi:hypothetical protein